jgi:oxalate decarboxylase/phosphoglucose isomerase-like protein (cupin superfamily)
MATVEFIDLGSEIKEDARGISFFPWQGRLREPGDLLRTFHLTSINPGQTRGNHLHPGFAEWLYVFHHPGVLLWEAAGKVEERLLAGGRTLVRIPPGIAHAVKNPGPEILYLLAWREAAGPGATEPESVPRPLGPGS